MNTIKLYGFVNALMMAIFGFCSSSVMLQQYKAASPEQYLLVCILGLVVVSGVSYVLTFAKLSAEVMRYSTTVVLLDAIAYASIDYYTAATGDLQTRWLANTLLLSVTQSLTGNIWEDLKERTGTGRKYQAFLNSTQSIGTAIGLLVALMCSLYLSYRIGTKEALILQASVSWMENAILIYMLKKYENVEKNAALETEAA